MDAQSVRSVANVKKLHDVLVVSVLERLDLEFESFAFRSVLVDTLDRNPLS